MKEWGVCTGGTMKVDFRNLAEFLAFDSWVGKSSQKSNFIKVLETMEKALNQQEAEPEPAALSVSERLVEEAENFIGNSYQEMDCYEMVAASLEKAGYNYRGQNGMAAYLAQEAKASDRPFNSFMTGEGLVRATGNILYTRTVPLTDQPERAAKSIVDELESKMKAGDLLSFSMKSAGHTGFISGEKGSRTYINSGRMDNNLHGNTLSKGVGEEPLMPEIMNWLKRAIRKNEPLTITVGRFEPEKLAAFRRSPVSFTV